MRGRPKVVFSRCIGNFFDFQIFNFISFLTKWQNGQLYFPGSYSEQPAKFVELMSLVQNLYMEDQAIKEKQAQKYRR